MMGGYPSEVAVRAWARLTRAQHQALTAVEQALSAAKLPPLAWYDVPLELERAGGSLRPFELEREMLLAQYNLSRLIDRMEKAGYVERRALRRTVAAKRSSSLRRARACDGACGR